MTINFKGIPLYVENISLANVTYSLNFWFDPFMSYDNQYIIDFDFITLRFDYSTLHLILTFESNEYQVGDRIVQMIILPYPQIEFEEVEELSSSERGHGGFGSTNI